jgi:hypothetical protein
MKAHNFHSTHTCHSFILSKTSNFFPKTFDNNSLYYNIQELDYVIYATPALVKSVIEDVHKLFQPKYYMIQNKVHLKWTVAWYDWVKSCWNLNEAKTLSSAAWGMPTTVFHSWTRETYSCQSIAVKSSFFFLTLDAWVHSIGRRLCPSVAFLRLPGFSWAL